ncbi:unnamed protein product [Gongylonema pulchrum]|uniref:ArgoN domain-containing protein n=1 Tax=Gongylonema pulchrum TaxID=637853 RepID=A0A183E0U3_9BILA|nr:unnamed protein product [Gongylonema pulchrum]
MMEIMRRPNYGTVGRAIELKANFKLLKMNTQRLPLYLYDVKITRPTGNVVENRDVCREVFWAVVTNNEHVFGTGYTLVYDDRHILFSLNKLSKEPVLEFPWPEARESLTPTRPRYLVRITLASFFTVNLDEKSLDFCNSLQFLNCLLTQRIRCPPSDVCREVFWAVVTNNAHVFGTGYTLVYDDRHILFSLNKLSKEPVLEFPWPEAREDLTRKKKGTIELLSLSGIFGGQVLMVGKASSRVSGHEVLLEVRKLRAGYVN